MAENERKGQQNEGEGNRTADRSYRAGVQEHLRQGNVEEEAARAARDVDADPETHRRAEEEGKSRSAGEAPGDLERSRRE